MVEVENNEIEEQQELDEALDSFSNEEDIEEETDLGEDQEEETEDELDDEESEEDEQENELEDSDEEGEEGNEEVQDNEQATPPPDIEPAPVQIETSEIDADEIKAAFPPELVPDTKEYLTRLNQEATEAAARQLGISVDDFDPSYDGLHMSAYQRAFNKLDSKAEELYKTEYTRVESQQRVAKNNETAKAKLMEILKTDSNVEEFEKATKRLTVGEYEDIKKAAEEKGDYSGFYNLANKVMGVKEKLEKVNTPKKEKVVEQEDEDDKPAGRFVRNGKAFMRDAHGFEYEI